MKKEKTFKPNTCLNCRYHDKQAEQFPCRWCTRLPVEHLDYWEKKLT